MTELDHHRYHSLHYSVPLHYIRFSTDFELLLIEAEPSRTTEGIAFNGRVTTGIDFDAKDFSNSRLLIIDPVVSISSFEPLLMLCAVAIKLCRPDNPAPDEREAPEPEVKLCRPVNLQGGDVMV